MISSRIPSSPSSSSLISTTAASVAAITKVPSPLDTDDGHGMDKYFQAISLFRRKNYEKCIEICNILLQNGVTTLKQRFNNNNNNNNNVNQRQVNNNQWMTEGIWQLKMRALTQRVYVDDLETNDDGIENEEIELERIATAARPGTSIKTAFVPRPSTSSLQQFGGRPRTLTAARPLTGMARPGTTSTRPGSAISSRPASRCSTARRVRMTSAAAYNLGDPTSSMYQASRMNPTIYAEKPAVIKPLFQFLFYHENDVQKAFTLCEAVADIQSNKRVDWWWDQQRGRCLITLNHPRRAEDFLKRSLGGFPHPVTYLLLCKTYMKLDQSQIALQLLDSALERFPYDISLRTQQARIYEFMAQLPESVQIYRKIAQMNPINAEALASIAVHYFYENQPEMALLYYRRILSMGAHSAELYCNIALCCLYGGQIDLVLPCFQRAIHLATTPEQRADIWYNLSFVALTTGDFNLAKRCLRLCLNSDSTNGAALNNLAVLSAQAGDYIKAKLYITAVKSVLSDCSEIENNLKLLEKF